MIITILGWMVIIIAGIGALTSLYEFIFNNDKELQFMRQVDRIADLEKKVNVLENQIKKKKVKKV